jgi:2-oxoglutarate dehydrogenase E2 component (dihydrolipoamide succinyltransferase)
MIDIKVPPLGESITEATVARWTKNEGEPIAPGETVVELETDKINVEVPAQKGGVLAKRVKNEGDVVKLGETLGIIDESREAAATTVPAPAPSVSPGAPAGTARVAPSAQRLADETGTSLAGIAGTGRGGVISKPDVIEQARKPEPKPVPSTRPSVPVSVTPSVESMRSRETREKLSTRRKRIAENLLQSHLSTAHLTTFNEIDMTAVIELRGRHKDRVEKEHGIKLSFMPFFAKASVMALRDFPIVNAQIDGDELIHKHYVNLGIAVASDQGLVVPNIKDAHSMGILGLARAIVALATKARDIKLTMDDLTGGTFTITNGGVFGSLVSTPIINYPQSGILGLHKIQDRAVVINGAVVARPMMFVALSYDHRVIDGQHAVLFLVRLKELMEDPAAMLIE